MSSRLGPMYGRIVQAVPLLAEAVDAASDVAGNGWEFAFDSNELRQIGLRTTDIRWMVAMQLLEALENSANEDVNEHRYVLSTKGSILRDRIWMLFENGEASSDAMRDEPSMDDLPRWEDDKRELWYGGQLIKQFRGPACNQVTILACFAELSWPTRIDDPLSPKDEIDPKKRLHDTIQSLNRKHVNKQLIRFNGDGTGTGVLWRSDFTSVAMELGQP